MEIILQETIDTLGQVGDVVTVKPGYARNYLLPQGLAVPATKGNLAALEQQKAAIEARRQRQQREAEELAAKLAEVNLIIEQRVGEDERLFGSVTAGDIATRLQDLGFEIDRKKVLLDEPIKTLGSHAVTIKTGYQHTTTITVTVEPQND